MPATEIAQSTESDQAMDTQKPLVDTVVSLEPTMEEEISQEEEEKDNIHDLTVNATITEQLAVEKEGGPKEIDE